MMSVVSFCGIRGRMIQYTVVVTDSCDRGIISAVVLKHSGMSWLIQEVN